MADGGGKWWGVLWPNLVVTPERHLVYEGGWSPQNPVLFWGWCCWLADPLEASQ
jgi:hypothetical protein